jgi:hypothetical protein
MQIASLLNGRWDELALAVMPGAELQTLAREKRAIVRSRKLGEAQQLLRLAWLYGPAGMSLRAAAGWACGSGLAQLSDVAVLKALRRMADWMEALVGRALENRLEQVVACERPIVLIDATSVVEPGGKTSDWLLHCRYRCGVGFTGFELTDQHGGEHLSRHVLQKGELVIADRGYARGPGIAHVVDCGADYLIRAGWRALAWRDSDGKRLDLLGRLKHLKPGEVADLAVQVAVEDRLLATRLIVLARDEDATAQAQRRVKRKAQDSCRTGDPRSMTAARYLIVVTSLDAKHYTAQKVLDLYRMRWQIELAFKRLKSLLHFDRLPAKDKDLARTWLNSHLLLALVLDTLTQQALDSPPSAARNARAAALYLAHAPFAEDRSHRHRPRRH